MQHVNNFSRNTSVRFSACFTKLVVEARMELAIEREREREKTLSIVVRHVLLASSEFHIGARRYRELFITRNSFTSPTAGYTRRFPARRRH